MLGDVAPGFHNQLSSSLDISLYMIGMLGFAVKHAHEVMLRLLGASELEFRETAHKISNDSIGSIAVSYA
jgi:hypothetical protein